MENTIKTGKMFNGNEVLFNGSELYCQNGNTYIIFGVGNSVEDVLPFLANAELVDTSSPSEKTTKAYRQYLIDKYEEQYSTETDVEYLQTVLNSLEEQLQDADYNGFHGVAFDDMLFEGGAIQKLIDQLQG